MAETYDVVVVGAGNHALACAGYLAKSGLKVCVLELYPIAGGGAVTEELTLPGFKHNTHANFMTKCYQVIDELELAKYGVEVYEGDKAFSAVFADDTCMHLYTDPERMYQHIAEFNKHDAQAMRDFVEPLKAMAPVFLAGAPSAGAQPLLLPCPRAWKAASRGATSSR